MFDVLIYLKIILDCSTFTNHSLPLRSLQEKKTRIYIRLLSIGTPHLARIGNFPFFFSAIFFLFLKHQNTTFWNIKIIHAMKEILYHTVSQTTTVFGVPNNALLCSLPNCHHSIGKEGWGVIVGKHIFSLCFWAYS